MLLLAGSAALLIGFIWIEAVSEAPLAPLRLFRERTLAGGNLIVILTGAPLFAWFFIATLYLQQVRGYSPLQAGLAFLAASLAGLLGSGIAQALATKVGIRTAALAGVGLMIAGLVLQMRISADGSYFGDLMPAFILMGSGSGFAFVAGAIGALAGVEERDTGFASGLVSTSQQIGGAIGVAVLSTVAVSRTQAVLPGGTGSPDAVASALTEGFQAAFAAALAFPAAAALVTLLVVRGARASHGEAAAVASAAE